MKAIEKVGNLCHISYHIKSYIISYYISYLTSYHIVSYIISLPIISYIISYIMSYITSYHLISCIKKSLILCYVKLFKLLCSVVWHCISLHYITLHCWPNLVARYTACLSCCLNEIYPSFIQLMSDLASILHLFYTVAGLGPDELFINKINRLFL